MAVVLLTGDLMVASRVEGAARRAGVTLLNFSDADGVVDHCTKHDARLLIVDLSSPSGDVSTIVERFKTAGVARPPMIAFGPHVHETRLAAAAAAGCDEVVSRGQFFANLDAVFARREGESSNTVPPNQGESPED